MLTTLTLLRHGQTAWNAEGRWQGHAAVPLDEVGRQQADALGQYYVQNPPNFTHLYCSDLLRTVETATILNHYLQLPIIYSERLREIDVGEWQGMTQSEVLAWDEARFHQFMENPSHNIRPGGESNWQLAERSVRALSAIVRQHPRAHVLVVTHGGVIRQSLIRLVDIRLDYIVPNTALTELQFDHTQQSWMCSQLTVTPHLDDGFKSSIDG
jgi:broad specificity phosphatase PhoE